MQNAITRYSPPPDTNFIRRNVFFLDAALSDLFTLTSSLPANAEVHLIDPSQDGLEQIALTLEGRSGIDAIHLFSHGSTGSLLLGSTTLSSSTINSYAITLSQIGASLSPTGDILLYGCNIGAGDVGQAFVESIARLTQADVATSDDLTGSAALGGDWALEVQIGAIESTPMAVAGFEGVLENVAPTLTAFSAAVDATNEDSTVLISLYDLLVKGDEADDDGTVDAFVIKLLQSGSLKIGVDAASATPYTWSENHTIDGTHHAYWTPAPNANGTLNTFMVVAMDNSGAESTTAVQATVTVAAVNDAPTLRQPLAFSLSAKTEYATGDYPYSVISSDINGDGYADLVVANYNDEYYWNQFFHEADSLSVLLSTGGTGFAPQAYYTVGADPVSLTALDLNGDGRNDLVAANSYSGTISVLLNKADGTIPQVTYATGSNPYALTGADFNGDGKADLAVANYDSNTLSLFLNNGDGSLAEKVDYTTGVNPRSVVSGDFDSDGDLDLAVTNHSSANISVFLNNGNGTFAAKVDFMVGEGAHYITSADFNNDGKLDLAVTNLNSDTVSVLLNKGNGTFKNHVLYATGDAPSQLASADLNGDGYADLAVANAGSNSISVLLNKGDGTFAAKVDTPVGATPISIISNDINSDGKADLTVSNVNSNNLYLFLNNSSVPVATTTFTEHTPVQLISNIFINDTEGDAEWNGGSLKVQITGNAEATDSLSLPTSFDGTALWIDTNGNKLMWTTTQIGTVDAASVSNNTAWTFTFNANATSALVQQTARLIMFNNSSATSATAERSVTVTVADNHNASASVVQIINERPLCNTLTGSVAVIEEDGVATITVSDLFTQSHATDDGSVEAYVVKSVSSGTLKIGADAATATAWDVQTNNVLDATHRAWWSPDANANGVLDAFTVVAKDNKGVESSTPVQATVMVTSVNDIPVLTLPTPLSQLAETPARLLSDIIITDADGNAGWNGGTLKVKITDHVQLSDTLTLPVTNPGASGIWLDTTGNRLMVATTQIGTADAALVNGGTEWSFTFNAHATSEFVQQVARSVMFNNSSTAPNMAERTMTLTITDNEGGSAVAVQAFNEIPRLTAFSAAVDTVNEDSTVVITLADLLAKGNETDDDGTVVAFVIKLLQSGSLKIGVDAASATPYTWSENHTIDGTHHAYWTPAPNANGTLNTFMVVAMDNSGAESTTAVQATVTVAAVNDAPTLRQPLAFSLSAKTEYATGDYPYSVISSDINGDGYADLVVANYNDTWYNSQYYHEADSLSVLLSTGGTGFAPQAYYTVGADPASLTALDINGDGRNDIVAANSYSGTISVLLNKADGTITPQVTYATGSNPSALTGADFNGDGKADLAVANYDSNTLSLFLNNGDGSLAEKVDYTTGVNPRSVVSGDFDSDGDLDLAVTNHSSANISVFLNNGNGTFAAKVDFMVGEGAHYITSADFNNDGKLDLAVTNYNSDTVSVLLNKGNGSFKNHVIYTTGDGPQQLASADLNGDGYADLAVANAGSDSMSVLLNNGDGTFAAKVDTPVGATPISIISNDINSDGKADLTVSNVNSNNLYLFLNNSSVPVATTTFTEHTPVQLISNIFINDTEGDAEWNGGSLKVQITGNAEATDSLSLPTSFDGTALWIDTNGNKLMWTTTQIGTVDAASVSNNTAWTFTFNANATSALVQQTARLIMFNNSSTTSATAERSVTVTVTDTHNASASVVQIINERPLCNTLTGSVAVIEEDGVATITVSDLFTQSHATDDGSVEAYVVKSVSSGTLKIGIDAATATAWDAQTYTMLDATHRAWWCPDANANGTLDAFTVVARDNKGVESSTPVQATVMVTSVNDIPVITLPTPLSQITETPARLLSDIIITDADGNAGWNGGTLKVKITDHVQLSDTLTLPVTNPGASGIWLDTTGNRLMVATTQIGTADAVLVNGGTEWSFTFNAHATSELVQQVARSVMFNNSSTAQNMAERSMTITITDNEGGSAVAVQAFNEIPRLTAFSAAVDTVNEDSTVVITLADLLAKGNETDDDGTVVAFVIKLLQSGSLKIGVDAASATPYTWSENHTIDGTHHAYWTPAPNANGTLNTFMVVAMDNSGAESTTAVQATVTVAAVNDAPTLRQPLALSLSTKSEYATGDYPYSVISNDINGDGYADLVVANYNNEYYPNQYYHEADSLSVLLSTGGTGFAPQAYYTVGADPVSLTALDLNGDGRNDLVAANSYSGTISVLLNKADGTFTPQVTYATGSNPYALTGADFNGDGKADLAVANYDSNTLSLFLNNGDGTFAAKVDYTTGANPLSVVSGDFDSDGDLDLAVTNASSGTISVFLNNGDGTFAGKVDSMVGSGAQYITSTDFNNDGNLDLAVTHYNSDTVSMLLNKGNGTFKNHVVYATGDAPYQLASADLNGDGYADLAVANLDSNSISVLLNKGDGTFAAKVDTPVGTRPISIISNDINGDGKADLTVTNLDSNNLYLFLNNSSLPVATIFTEQTPVQVISNIFIDDIEGNTEWNGGTLKVQITGNAGAADSLTLPTSFDGNALWIDTNGNKLMSLTTQIGTVDAASVSNNTTWTFTFNANATSALVQQTARAIMFNNSTPNPGSAERSITLTVADNHNASASLVQSIIIQSVNAVPTFTAFSNAVDTTNEDTAVLITLADLLAHGDEADSDGAVNAYVVKSLSSGTLKIGVDAATATAWSSAVNNTLDATHHAWWTPGHNSNGTLNAFTVVARDNEGATSTTAVQATVTVVPVNDAPTMQWQPTASFAAKPTYATTAGPTVVTAGDFNGDGSIDLAIANTDSNTVSIRLNNGNGTFSDKMDTTAGATPYAITSADFNNDNKADLVVVNRESNTISFLADGIAAKVDYATGTTPVSVTHADVNGDGKLDLVVANEGSNTVSVLTNQGYGTFATKVDYNVGDMPRSVITADVNSDGHTDLVVANNNSDTISVLLNNGDVTFATKKDYSTGDAPVSVTAADFNGDGYTDLAVANATSNTVSLLLNNSDGTFAIHGIYNTGTTPDSLTSADFNNDGNIDLAVLNTAGQTISLLMNQGEGSFTEKVDITVGATPRSIISDDFDGDGKADLAFVSSGSNTLSVLMNNTQPVDFTSFARKTAVPVAGNIIINDGDGDADWNGGTLMAQITANAEAADYLTLPTANPGGTGIWLDTNGNKLMAGTTNIGTADAATVSNNTAWMLTFNANATNVLVQSVARAISIINSPDAQNVTADTINRSITLTATDRSGNSAFAVLHHSDDVAGNVFGVNPNDVTAPLLESFVQSEAANGIAASSNLELIFNETIQRGNGLIEIHSGSETGALVASYNAASSTNISITDNTLTINPSADLQNGTHYFVTFEAGAIKDRAGNSYAGTDVCHVKTEGIGAEYHNLTGDVTFWKTGRAITNVTTTLTSEPATQLVELRHNQIAADGSRTVELWATSPSTTVNSLQLEFVLPTGSKASWQSYTGLPADWTLLANSELDGQFILGGMSTTALASGPVKLGTLALTATNTPQHAELLLAKGFIGDDTLSAFGISLESSTSGLDSHYQHLNTLAGTYNLAGNKIAGQAESHAINANDALAALKIAVAINPNADGSAVSPYQFLAADVNHDGIIRSTDALNILKMAVKLSSAPQGEWIFTTENAAESAAMDRNTVDWSHVIPPVTLDHDIVLDLIGIVKGDVDGSWAA